MAEDAAGVPRHLDNRERPVVAAGTSDRVSANRLEAALERDDSPVALVRVGESLSQVSPSPPRRAHNAPFRLLLLLLLLLLLCVARGCCGCGCGGGGAAAVRGAFTPRGHSRTRRIRVSNGVANARYLRDSGCPPCRRTREHCSLDSRLYLSLHGRFDYLFLLRTAANCPSKIRRSRLKRAAHARDGDRTMRRRAAEAGCAYRVLAARLRAQPRQRIHALASPYRHPRGLLFWSFFGYIFAFSSPLSIAAATATVVVAAAAARLPPSSHVRRRDGKEREGEKTLLPPDFISHSNSRPRIEALRDRAWNACRGGRSELRSGSHLAPRASRSDAPCIPQVPGDSGDRDGPVGVRRLVPQFRRHFQILGPKESVKTY